MFNKLLNRWLSKEPADFQSPLSQIKNVRFLISLDKITVGELKSEDGKWIFKYAEEFKQHKEEYNLIVGFSDINKEYYSERLWPFFQIRIPGLKQPAIQKIIKTENIDQENEVELLKRFGNKTIANPYELELAI